MEWEFLGFVLIGLTSICSYLWKIEPTLPYSFEPGKRDSRFDQMRGIAMIGIVCIHIHSYFQFFHAGEKSVITWTLLFSNLSRFSVPVFIFGSALYISKKSNYWASKFYSIILPYTIASVFGYFIKYSNYSASEFFIKLIIGDIFAPYYFVPLLLQFYLLYALLSTLLINDGVLKNILYVSIFLNIVSNLNLLNFILPEWYRSISIFNYIGFFALGLNIRNPNRKNFPSQLFFKLILSILTFILIILIVFFSYNGLDLKNHHFIYPIIIIFLLNYLLPKEPKHYSFKVLAFIGKNSLYIFLLHPFVIHFMHTFDPLTFGNPVFAYMMTLLLNIGIPSLFAYLITYLSGIVSNR